MSILRRSRTRLGWTSPKDSWIFTILLVYIIPLVAVIVSAYGSNLARAAINCGTSTPTNGSAPCESNPFLGYSLIAAAAVATLVAQGWRQTQSAKREAIRSKHLKRFNHRFKSVVDPLGELLSSDQSEDDARAFIRSILNSGGNLFVHEDLRLTIYQLDEREFPEAATPHAMLQLVGCGGRGDAPRSEFLPDTSEGSWAIEAAKGSGAYAIVKVGADDPRFKKLESSSWESFMAFPIRQNLKQNNIGILMVDSQTRTAWTYEDQAVGTTIAQIVSFGLDLLNPGAENTKIEADALRQELERIKKAQGTDQVP